MAAMFKISTEVANSRRLSQTRSSGRSTVFEPEIEHRNGIDRGVAGSMHGIRNVSNNILFQLSTSVVAKTWSRIALLHIRAYLTFLVTPHRQLRQRALRLID